VIASNHPSYLDPVLLSLRIERPVHFMAWDHLFGVPILGPVMRLFGAIPVNTQSGQGRAAYDTARALVERGELVGIFPEAKRSRTGWMEPALREGAARLALETGAPLVPATIQGAFRAWPHFQSLPKPARIRVRFHQPIDPTPYRSRPEQEALDELIAELRRRVERSLLPGVKADLRLNLLWRTPAPWPQLYESAPPLALALALFWKTKSLPLILPVYGYIAYLLLDHFLIPQRRLVKWLRTASPVLFAMGYSETVLKAFERPPLPAAAALAAITLGALFPYLYEHGQNVLGFVRGLVFVIYLELLVQFIAPLAPGPHLALPLFAAVFAWERRTVFWRYTATVLAVYCALLVREVGANAGVLMPHATAALVAWGATRLLALPLRTETPVEEPPPGLGLNL
jgi:1-acyl-sn-glycerol-3-phosphate acyltransferase